MTVSLHSKAARRNLPATSWWEYLGDSSKKDKKWDALKTASRRMSETLVGAEDLKLVASRMHGCADWLQFLLKASRETGEIKWKLHNTRFCNHRLCQTCQFIRSRMWQTQFRQAAPALIEQHPGGRWLVLTLTVRNPDIHDTRAALGDMNKAWNRMVKRTEFRDVLGWIRATEVTRGGKGKEGKQGSTVDNTSHPHFHVLLFVRSAYFRSRYISQARWLEAWRSCMRDTEITQVDVRIVKPREPTLHAVDAMPDKAQGGGDGFVDDGLWWLMSGAVEVLKYTSKAQDLLPYKEPRQASAGVLDSASWVRELARQIKGLRFMATGGVLKDALKDAETMTDDDLIHAVDKNQSDPDDDDEKVNFGFSGEVKRYRRKRRQ